MTRWTKVSTDRLKGPHEGQELELMLLRAKPAALVNKKTFEAFRPYVEAGRFDARWFRYGGFDDKIGAYIVVQRGDTWRLYRLIKEFSGEGRDHVKIGLLLGYSKAAIRWFSLRMEINKRIAA
jgi:hypothetical protein